MNYRKPLPGILYDKSPSSFKCFKFYKTLRKRQFNRNLIEQPLKVETPVELTSRVNRTDSSGKSCNEKKYIINDKN